MINILAKLIIDGSLHTTCLHNTNTNKVFTHYGDIDQLLEFLDIDVSSSSEVFDNPISYELFVHEYSEKHIKKTGLIILFNLLFDNINGIRNGNSNMLDIPEFNGHIQTISWNDDVKTINIFEHVDDIVSYRIDLRANGELSFFDMNDKMEFYLNKYISIVSDLSLVS